MNNAVCAKNCSIVDGRKSGERIEGNYNSTIDIVVPDNGTVGGSPKDCLAEYSHYMVILPPLLVVLMKFRRRLTQVVQPLVFRQCRKMCELTVGILAATKLLI